MSTRVTKAINFGGARGGQQGGRVGDQIVPGGPAGQGGGPGGGRGLGNALGNAANQRFTVELYAQAFNLLNRTNFVNFSGNQLSPFFGKPTSAQAARRVQIGMGFRF